jgi:hypothetical protein
MCVLCTGVCARAEVSSGFTMKLSAAHVTATEVVDALVQHRAVGSVRDMDSGPQLHGMSTFCVTKTQQVSPALVRRGGGCRYRSAPKF